MSDKNLAQCITIKFCVKINGSAGEMLELLTLAYGEDILKNSNVFNGIGGSRKGELCKMIKEVGRQKRKG
jgi:hypothetical protein